jgi:hypothetical protein
MNNAAISVELHDATDSSAVLSLAFGAGSAMPFEGELYGPFCEYAKTLPNRTAARIVEGDRRVEFLITEPCYWTPQLPFLYDLRLRAEGDRGVDDGFTRSIGLRRLTTHGRDLRLSGERIVLRGVSDNDFAAERLPQARSAETALIAPFCDAALFNSAAKTGVFTVAAIARNTGDLTNVLNDLSWRPAAALVLLDGVAVSADASQAARRMNLILAQRMQAAEAPGPNDVQAAADLVAVELAAGERPPSWMASLGKPVIAIRPGGAYADLHGARAACDRLQAELAPEFDLAGYFV